jgi:hypothetical protein
MYDPVGASLLVAASAAPSSSSSGASTSVAPASPLVLFSHPSPSASHPYFWVDFMVQDTSSLLHSSTSSRRFHADVLLFISYLIGKQQTHESLALILADYHSQMQAEDAVFEQFAATVLGFIREKRALS